MSEWRIERLRFPLWGDPVDPPMREDDVYDLYHDSCGYGNPIEFLVRRDYYCGNCGDEIPETFVAVIKIMNSK